MIFNNNSLDEKGFIHSEAVNPIKVEASIPEELDRFVNDFSISILISNPF